MNNYCLKTLKALLTTSVVTLPMILFFFLRLKCIDIIDTCNLRYLMKTEFGKCATVDVIAIS